MDLAELLIGQIPEAIYFALFLILAKGLKEKRILFTVLMVFEYLALKHFIHFNVGFQFAYTFMTFLILKVLYKDKAQIIDIFVFVVSSIYLIIVSAISYGIIYFTIRQYIYAVILNRALLFISLILANNKIRTLYKKYAHYWNRHREEKVKVRSLTLRNISVIIFNLMFYIINFGMVFFLKYLK